MVTVNTDWIYPRNYGAFRIIRPHHRICCPSVGVVIAAECARYGVRQEPKGYF